MATKVKKIIDNYFLNEEYVPRLRTSSVSRIGKNIPYIHFLTILNNKIQLLSISENSVGTIPSGLEYSQDTIQWFELTEDILDNPIEFKDGHLWLRGKSKTGTVYDTYSQYKMNFHFETDAKIVISGDIRTLIDWENYQNCDTSKAGFSGLFSNCPQIVDASLLLLNIIDLAYECYSGMFEFCINLKYPPLELPATLLSESCYEYMFYDCESLEKFPALPKEYKIKSSFRNPFIYMIPYKSKINGNEMISIPLDFFIELITED